MTEEQRTIYNGFFKRYNSPSDFAEVRIQRTLYKPENEYECAKLATYDKWAEETIKTLESAIEKVKIYRMAVCERYNELQFANVQKVVKLKREKHYGENKVYYYLLLIDRYEDGHEQTTKSVKYAGTERKQAIADFEKFAKENKNFIAIKEIEKSKWEK